MSHTEFRAASPDAPAWRATLVRRQAYHRLYVHTPDGVPVGWYDLESGDVYAVDAALQEGLGGFVASWIASPDAAGLATLPSPHPPAARPEVRRPAAFPEQRPLDAASPDSPRSPGSPGVPAAPAPTAADAAPREAAPAALPAPEPGSAPARPRRGLGVFARLFRRR